MRSTREIERTQNRERICYDASSAKRVKVAAYISKTIATSVELTDICVLGANLQCVMSASEPYQEIPSHDMTNLETVTCFAIAGGATIVWSAEHAEA